MQTAFITVAITLPENPADIQPRIEATLQAHGTPLRWSITHLETTKTQRIAHLEAIVTTP